MLILIFSQSSCNSIAWYEKIIFGYFDTQITISSYMKSQDEFINLCEKAESEFSKYHKLFDHYNNYEGTNNIKSINDAAGLYPVKVSSEIIELIEFSKAWHKNSGGQLNIAFGPVLEIWHSYREASDILEEYNRLPTMPSLTAASEHINIEGITLDKEKSTVYLNDKNMSLDTGAVAKGFACQKVKEYLNNSGYNSFIINAGGNAVTSGAPLNGNGHWVIGIQAPDNFDNGNEAGGILDAVYLTDKSAVTSGDYQRYFTSGGVRYHHIIDPKTLMPANYYRSVTVIADSSGVADALSTSCFLLPLDRALSLIENTPGADAVFVMANNTITYSSGFSAYLQQN
ncbi:MAG: FAD:protein FMN transferase [Clostridiales bacterium]|nr:FAD:protein FMN transferase [Clostridiales bacterium]